MYIDVTIIQGVYVYGKKHHILPPSADMWGEILEWKNEKIKVNVTGKRGKWEKKQERAIIIVDLDKKSFSSREEAT
jgi:hypothetical protein